MTEPYSRFYRCHHELLEFPLVFSLFAVIIDKFYKHTGRFILEASSDPKKRERIEKKLTGEGPAVKRMQSFGRYLFQTLLLRAVDNYLTYLADLLTLIFRERPATLRSNESVRVDFVLQYGDMNDLVSALAERRVHNLSYLGMKELATNLHDRLGFALFLSEKELALADKLVEMRNLISHNRAIVNNIFLTRLPDFPAKVGEEVHLEFKEVESHVVFLMKSAVDIDARAAKKFRLKLKVHRQQVEKKLKRR